MVDIGKLNKRITFQKAVEQTDAMGQDCMAYEDYCTVWATVKPFKASDHSLQGKLSPETTHKIYIRYRDDLEPDMRILYNGRKLYPAGTFVDLDERHELLEIQAEERVDKEQ